jgi:hypothetical protein
MGGCPTAETNRQGNFLAETQPWEKALATTMSYKQKEWRAEEARRSASNVLPATTNLVAGISMGGCPTAETNRQGNFLAETQPWEKALATTMPYKQKEWRAEEARRSASTEHKHGVIAIADTHPGWSWSPCFCS